MDRVNTDRGNRTAGMAGVVVAVAWCVLVWTSARAEVLTPPYFNLAEGRRVTATATCGEGIEEPELFCKLIGTNSPDFLTQHDNLLIQGQVGGFITG